MISVVALVVAAASLVSSHNPNRGLLRGKETSIRYGKLLVEPDVEAANRRVRRAADILHQDIRWLNAPFREDRVLIFGDEWDKEVPKFSGSKSKSKGDDLSKESKTKKFKKVESAPEKAEKGKQKGSEKRAEKETEKDKPKGTTGKPNTKSSATEGAKKKGESDFGSGGEGCSKGKESSCEGESGPKTKSPKKREKKSKVTSVKSRSSHGVLDAAEETKEPFVESIEELAEPSELPEDEEMTSPTAGPTIAVPSTTGESANEDSSSGGMTAEEMIQGLEDNSTDPEVLMPEAKDTLNVSEIINTTEARMSDIECPVNGWPSFKMQSFTGDFIRYPFRRGQLSSDNRTGEVMFSVSNTCTYKIRELSADNSMRFQTPLAWLDMGVLYFSGVPGTRINVTLSGDTAPDIADILVLDGEAFVEVQISSNSSAVIGDAPVSWLFPTRTEAKEFEYFLNSVHRYAPEVFMTNNNMACGSGPVCKVLGNGVCFFDPSSGSLGAGNKTHGGFFGDSMEWFETCAGMIGCEKMEGSGRFLYFAAPDYKIEDTVFSFVGPAVLDGPISFSCSADTETTLLSELADELVHDPFHSLGLGGPGDLGVDHHFFL